MNFILYVHDYGPDPVWPYEPGITEKVQGEIASLVDGYTMGRVTVDLVRDGVPDVRRPEGDGHDFKVMCSACLDEPFDVLDVNGKCPEWLPEEEDEE